MGGVTCMSHLKVKGRERCRYDLQKNPFDTCVVNADITTHLEIRLIFFAIEFYCLLAHFCQAYYYHHHFFYVHAYTHTCENCSNGKLYRVSIWILRTWSNHNYRITILKSVVFEERKWATTPLFHLFKNWMTDLTHMHACTRKRGVRWTSENDLFHSRDSSCI
jgi:hypothetical protein